MKSTQERQQEQRQQRLEDMRRQVREGTLVIRQMTDEERAKNPPRAREAEPRRNGRQRRR
jgi:hypothetical protein